MRKILTLFVFLALQGFVWAEAGYTVKYQKMNNSFFENPDPGHSAWSSVKATKVKLLNQNIDKPILDKRTVPNLQMKAIHNRNYVAFKLEWSDPTENNVTDIDKTSDACAIQFPRKKASETVPFMGHDKNPVVIFHWKAIWDRDITSGYVKLEDLYPNAYTETYMFGREIARDAKNPVSNENRKKPVEELHAEGYGTSTTAKEADIRAKGAWTNNKWNVVFVYKFNEKLIPTLKPGTNTGIGFAVWGGNNKEVGGRKNYAPWQNIKLEK